MKEKGVYVHRHANDIKDSDNHQKFIRLAQDLGTLTTSLPVEFTNGIFVRHDKERVDVWKICIMGSEGTPYAHGAFVYDCYFDDNYPNRPPKFTIKTTGGDSVRFNPNLYANGKVCLSLLGTWGDNWSLNSTMFQILLSV